MLTAGGTWKSQPGEEPASDGGAGSSGDDWAHAVQLANKSGCCVGIRNGSVAFPIEPLAPEQAKDGGLALVTRLHDRLERTGTPAPCICCDVRERPQVLMLLDILIALVEARLPLRH